MLTPAMGAGLMTLSTVVVAINASMLKVKIGSGEKNKDVQTHEGTGESKPKTKEEPTSEMEDKPKPEVKDESKAELEYKVIAEVKPDVKPKTEHGARDTPGNHKQFANQGSFDKEDAVASQPKFICAFTMCPKILYAMSMDYYRQQYKKLALLIANYIFLKTI